MTDSLESDQDFRAFVRAAQADDADARRDTLATIAPEVIAFVKKTSGKQSEALRRAGLTEDDVAQEVVLRMSRWRPEIGEHARAKVFAWAHVVAQNLVRSALRSGTRWAPMPEEDVLPARREGADQQLAMRRVAQTTLECAAKLAPPYDEVFRLALDDGDLSAEGMALHFGKVTEHELDQVDRGTADEETRVRVGRARSLMDKWKSRMRTQLAECIERTHGEGILPSGIRFASQPGRKHG